MTLSENNAIDSTIRSYPERGEYGDSSYRGNCSGYLVRDLINHFKPKSVLDPMEGSGTTGDVCKELNIEYCGLDLKKGFDLVNDQIKGQYDFIFFHPPYWDIVRYSENQNDLSASDTYDIFMGRLRICVSKLYSALSPNGTLAILIGDKKHKGKLYTFFQEIISWNIGMLSQIIIKTQHNTQSSRKIYSGQFIPIHHEYVLIIKKEA